MEPLDAVDQPPSLKTHHAEQLHLRPSGFRSDIQGLRALAVGIVLLYHLWPDRFVGGFVGVDVFFVISGFLITSHLIKSPPRSWADVAKFWARRVRRLLPASLLVLFVVGIATFLVAPQSIWADTGRQILSAGALRRQLGLRRLQR